MKWPVCLSPRLHIVHHVSAKPVPRSSHDPESCARCRLDEACRTHPAARRSKHHRDPVSVGAHEPGYRTAGVAAAAELARDVCGRTLSRWHQSWSW
jgi:hypothetical protein